MECSGAPHDLCNHSVNALIFSDWSLPKLFFIIIFTGYATESTTENISARHMYQIAWSKRTDPALQDIQITSKYVTRNTVGDFYTYSIMI